MNQFNPELGQQCWSNTPWQPIEMDCHMESFLADLGEALVDAGLCEQSPTSNTGDKYECEVFKVRAYCWCDGGIHPENEGCPPNFEWRDFRACWYKHCWRGNSVNRELDRKEREQMRQECFDHIFAQEKPA